jgi:hypothetical protein
MKTYVFLYSSSCRQEIVDKKNNLKVENISIRTFQLNNLQYVITESLLTILEFQHVFPLDDGGLEDILNGHVSNN